MRESGTIAGRTPRDRSDYTRMDQRIDAMIQDSQVESLVQFAQEHSGRVGDMLGNYRLGPRSVGGIQPRSAQKTVDFDVGPTGPGQLADNSFT